MRPLVVALGLLFLAAVAAATGEPQVHVIQQDYTGFVVAGWLAVDFPSGANDTLVNLFWCSALDAPPHGPLQRCLGNNVIRKRFFPGPSQHYKWLPAAGISIEESVFSHTWSSMISYLVVHLQPEPSKLTELVLTLNKSHIVHVAHQPPTARPTTRTTTTTTKPTTTTTTTRTTPTTRTTTTTTKTSTKTSTTPTTTTTTSTKTTTTTPTTTPTTTSTTIPATEAATEPGTELATEPLPIAEVEVEINVPPMPNIVTTWYPTAEETTTTAAPSTGPTGPSGAFIFSTPIGDGQKAPSHQDCSKHTHEQDDAQGQHPCHASEVKEEAVAAPPLEAQSTISATIGAGKARPPHPQDNQTLVALLCVSALVLLGITVVAARIIHKSRAAQMTVASPSPSLEALLSDDSAIAAKDAEILRGFGNAVFQANRANHKTE